MSTETSTPLWVLRTARNGKAIVEAEDEQGKRYRVAVFADAALAQEAVDTHNQGRKRIHTQTRATFFSRAEYNLVWNTLTPEERGRGLVAYARSKQVLKP